MESPWAESVDARCEPCTLAQGGGRQLAEVAPGKDRRLPVARSRPCRSARRVARNLGQHAIRRKSSLVALSNVTVEHIERARKLVPIVSVQNRYSFADREWDYV